MLQLCKVTMLSCRWQSNIFSAVMIWSRSKCLVDQSGCLIRSTCCIIVFYHFTIYQSGVAFSSPRAIRQSWLLSPVGDSSFLTPLLRKCCYLAPMTLKSAQYNSDCFLTGAGTERRQRREWGALTAWRSSTLWVNRWLNIPDLPTWIFSLWIKNLQLQSALLIRLSNLPSEI